MYLNIVHEVYLGFRYGLGLGKQLKDAVKVSLGKKTCHAVRVWQV